MASPEAFDALSDALTRAVGEHPDLIGLALMGSASDAGRSRRDEWSDHDFLALSAPGRGGRARSALNWLPDAEGIAIVAREGDVGFVVVYDNGHVMEFAVADGDELRDAQATDATVAVDDSDRTVDDLLARARARARGGDAFDPESDARLVLVKLLIGVGRARRGELLVAGSFVRGWAIPLLIRVVRARHPGGPGSHRDVIDPLRRFERDFPEWAASLAAASAREVEPAARATFDLLCRLEPRWDGFPRRGAEAVARRLGWPVPTWTRPE